MRSGIYMSFRCLYPNSGSTGGVQGAVQSKEEEMKKKYGVVLITLLAMLLTACGKKELPETEKPEMPDLCGMTVEEARAVLKYAGFTNLWLKRDGDILADDPDYRPGDAVKVTAQDRAAGEHFYENEAIVLTCEEVIEVYFVFRAVAPSPCDFMLCLDEFPIIIFDHEQTKIISVTTTTGPHTLTISTEDTEKTLEEFISSKESVEVTFSGASTVYGVVSYENGMNIKELSVRKGAPISMQPVKDVSGHLLTDAAEELRSLGFTNVTCKPLSGEVESLQSCGDWVCVEQSVEAGIVIHREEDSVELLCVPIAEYFAPLMNGHTLKEIEDSLLRERIPVRYVDADSGSSIDGLIRRCPAEKKEGWTVEKVCSDPDEALVLALRYVGEGDGSYPGYSGFRPQKLTAEGVTYEIDAAYGYESIDRRENGTVVSFREVFLFDYDTGEVFYLYYSLSEDGVPTFFAERGTFTSVGTLPGTDVTVELRSGRYFQLTPCAVETGAALAEIDVDGIITDTLFRPVSIADFAQQYEAAELLGRVK